MLPINVLLLVLPLTLAAPAIPWMHRPARAAEVNAPEAELPALEPELDGSIQDSSPRQQKNTNEVFRVSEGNSIALFNGVPVELGTGGAGLTISNFNDNPSLVAKRDLREKLGLDFLNDPNMNEETLKARLRDPSVGAMKLPDRRPGRIEMSDLEQPESPEAPNVEKGVAKSEEPAEEEHDVKEEVEKKPTEVYSGNSFMVYNGQAIKNPVKPTISAFDVIEKRDIPDKLGLGLFDAPASLTRGGRRKTATPEPVPPIMDDEDLTLDNTVARKDNTDLFEDESVAVPGDEYVDVKEIASPAARKQFVIYNGKSVPAEESMLQGKRLKKPRPAFRKTALKPVAAPDSESKTFEDTDSTLLVKRSDTEEAPSQRSQFVIYNGKEVPVGDAMRKAFRLKKPRPAFRKAAESAPEPEPSSSTSGDDGGDDAQPAPAVSKRSYMGRKYPGVNPFAKNPLTTKPKKNTGAGKPNSSDKNAKSTSDGNTNSETVVGSASQAVLPFTREAELVRVNKSGDFLLCNGRPCSFEGSGPFAASN